MKHFPSIRINEYEQTNPHTDRIFLFVSVVTDWQYYFWSLKLQNVSKKQTQHFVFGRGRFSCAVSSVFEFEY